MSSRRASYSPCIINDNDVVMGPLPACCCQEKIERGRVVYIFNLTSFAAANERVGFDIYLVFKS